MTKKISQNKKNQNEWLNWYVQHGGEYDLQLENYELTLFHEEHGFIAFFIYDDVLELHHMVGDGKFWQNILISIMQKEGLKTLRAFTRRNPKAWQRKYGGKITGYEMEISINELENRKEKDKNGK